MSQYSRSIASHARTTDKIYGLILAYPSDVTVRRLMDDNPGKLRDSNSVLAAIDLLEKEGKVSRVAVPGHQDHLASIKVRSL